MVHIQPLQLRKQELIQNHGCRIAYGERVALVLQDYTVTIRFHRQGQVPIAYFGNNGGMIFLAQEKVSVAMQNVIPALVQLEEEFHYQDWGSGFFRNLSSSPHRSG
jgi:hypothetical protein